MSRVLVTLLCACFLAAPLPQTPAIDPAAVDAALAEGRFEDALAASTRLWSQAPDRPGVRGAHGRALLRAGALREAQQVLEPLADDPAAGGKGLVALGRLAQFRGRHGRAAELAERALERAPDDPEVLFAAAELLPDRERSSGLLERFLELAPEERMADWIEAARGTLGLREVLGERAVWRVAATPERVEIPLRRVWNEGGVTLGYVLEAHIGPRDKPVRLMLDTGSTGLFLVERMARKRGFEFLAEQTAFGGGGDQRHRSRRGVFSTFRLGELRFEDALAGTTKTEIEPHGRFHGLLGIQALAGYRATLDLDAQKLVLERHDVAEEGFAGRPFWMVSGQMLVEARAAESEGMFLFDTGASWTVLSDRFARGLDGVRLERTRGMRGFGGAIDGASVVRGAEVRFAGFDAGRDGLRAFDMSMRNAIAGVEVSGYLGLDMLAERRITIDTVTQQVSVEAAGKRR